jgi:hypothetical protein
MCNLLIQNSGLLLDATLNGLAGESMVGFVFWLLLMFLGLIVIAIACITVLSWYFGWVFVVDDLFRWLGEPSLRINTLAIFLLGIPILNFFFAYIFVLNLTASIRYWSHENEVAIDNALHKTGLRSCHAGLLFVVCLILANRWQGFFIHASVVAFFVWILYVRKYRNALADVYQIMDAHHPAREDEAGEEE